MYYIAPMEMMVVDVAVLFVARRIAEHRAPWLVIVEHEGYISLLICEPALHLSLNQTVYLLEQCLLTALFCYAAYLYQTIQQLTVVVGIGPVSQPVVGNHILDKTVQLGLREPVLSVGHCRQRRKNSMECQ